ncbi:hypothetical protein T439DRAFT_331887 [Meredithblackwellia eburnea MCA 4105]
MDQCILDFLDESMPEPGASLEVFKKLHKEAKSLAEESDKGQRDFSLSVLQGRRVSLGRSAPTRNAKMEKNLANLTAAMEFCRTLSPGQRAFLFTENETYLYRAARDQVRRMPFLVKRLNEWSESGITFHIPKDLKDDELKKYLSENSDIKNLKNMHLKKEISAKNTKYWESREHDAAAALETLKGASMLMDLSKDSNSENPHNLETQANSLSKFIPRRRHQHMRTPVVQKITPLCRLFSSSDSVYIPKSAPKSI